VSSLPAPDAPDAPPLTLAEAAVLLSSGRGSSGERLQRAVEAQLVRRGVPLADREDIRADVALALLVSSRTQSLTLAAVAAHAARVARNKAIDHHRRLRREAPVDAIAERAGPLPEGSLQVDLDLVSGEVHRRDVSNALVELVRELPHSERRALTATATGTGHVGSGLGRSSHYRALDRARLRLSAAVRSRVAGGLAFPAVLWRALDHARAFLLPAGATAAAAIASTAFLLPAIDTPPPAAAEPPVSVRLAPTRLTVATRTQPPIASTPPSVLHRRVGRSTRVVVHAATSVIAARPAVIEQPSTVARAEPTPSAGLGPCRAAQLCQ
jgi:DNA-directed RNA polymerase specialized sigma24 family protein